MSGKPSVDLAGLSENEKKAVLQVLHRDSALRIQQEKKISYLKTELHMLRKRGALRPGIDANSCCARCLTQLGMLVNSGAPCPFCRKRVCKSCRQIHQERAWACIVCAKQMEIKAISGEWMTEHESTVHQQQFPSIVKGRKDSNFLDADWRRISNRDGSSSSSSPSSHASRSPNLPTRWNALNTYQGNFYDVDIIHPIKRPQPSMLAVVELAQKQALPIRASPKPQNCTSTTHTRPEIETFNGVPSGQEVTHRHSRVDHTTGPLVEPNHNKENVEKRPTTTIRAPNTPEVVLRRKHDLSTDTLKRRTIGVPFVRDDYVTTNDDRRRQVRPFIKQRSSMSLQDAVIPVPPILPLNRREHENRIPTRESLADEAAAVGNLEHQGYADTREKQKRTSVCSYQSESSTRSTQSYNIQDEKRRSQISDDNSDCISYATSESCSDKFEGFHGIEEHQGDGEITDESERADEGLLVVERRRVQPRNGSRPNSISPAAFRRVNFAHRDSMSSLSESEIEQTTGVLFRKVTCRRRERSEETVSTHRSSPRGRLRSSRKVHSSSSDDGSKVSMGSLPHIVVSDTVDPSASGGAVGSQSEKDSFHSEDDGPVDPVFGMHSRSQISLFGTRSESMSSVYSAAGGGRFGAVAVSGEILLSAKYIFKVATLEVHIKECHNLAAVDAKRNRSDPYVKVYLLPDKTKSGKRKTKVKKHTLNPLFDETLKFPIADSVLEMRTMWVSVWHSDIFGRNDFLGEVMLPLNGDLLDAPTLKWYQLQERMDCQESSLSYKGDIILSLQFVPSQLSGKNVSKGSLHVLVKEARNLMATRSNGTSDPFCKSYLLPDKSKSSKQKTSVVKKSCNPRWHHTFIYEDVSAETLKDRCLELTIWDYDKITSNDFLGGIRLNLGTGKHQGKDVDWMDAQGEELTLWRSVLDRPNNWIDGSLLLRSSMTRRASTSI